MSTKKGWFAVAMAATLLLAGCAQLTDGDGGRQPALTEAEARQAWDASFSNMQEMENVDAFAMDMSISTSGEGEVLTYSIAVDQSEDTFLFRMQLAPSYAQGGGGGGPAASLFTNLTMGQEIQDGVVYTVMSNLTGQAHRFRDHVPDEDDRIDGLQELESDKSTSGTPDLSPSSFMFGLNQTDQDVTIDSVESTTWKGRAAWRISFTMDNETMHAEGETIIYDDPRLPAHMEIDFRSKDGGASTPVADVQEGTLTMDLRFGEEVDIQLPDVPRGAVRVDTSEAPSDKGLNGTVSPSHSDEVPLGEVELHVANASRGGGFGFGDGSPPDDHIYLRLQADQGSSENADARLTFTDEDGDGYLSANDTYELLVKDPDLRGNVSVYWFDLWAQAYPMPAPEAGLLAAAAVVAALVWSRYRRD